MRDDPPLSATEWTALIERLDAMKEDSREVIAESRQLRATNRRLLAQIRRGHGHNREERRAAPQPAMQQQQQIQPDDENKE
jgi:hypothetical protein